MQPIFFSISVYESCADIPSASPSGQYWIDPVESGTPLQVWCEMDIEGGYWTLVYSYQGSASVAVTPVPNWDTDDAVIDISTTIPTTDDQMGAMDFSLWVELGDVVLFRSPLSLTMKCRGSFGGDIVRYNQGPLDCFVIDIPSGAPCTTSGSQTFHLEVDSCGPKVTVNGDTSRVIYYWDGCSTGDFPYHDACGNNHEPRVTDIRGWIYVRTTF